MLKFFRQKGLGDQSHKTPGDVLLFASLYGYVNVVKFIETTKVSLMYTNTFGDTLLHYACKGDSYEMVQYLLLKGLNPAKENKLLMTPIFYAIEDGNLKAASLLIRDRRCKVDHTDKFGETILHIAVKENH